MGFVEFLRFSAKSLSSVVCEKANTSKPYANSVCMCLVTQSCLTLCDPMDCSPPGCSVHGDSPGKNTTVDCHGLLQRIFPTQGSNPGLPHCRQILYYLSYREALILFNSQFPAVFFYFFPSERYFHSSFMQFFSAHTQVNIQLRLKSVLKHTLELLLYIASFSL